MCNFCNFKETRKGYINIGEEYQNSEYSPSVYLEKVKSDFYLVSTGDDETTIPVNYCPKCGRKLV